MGMRVYLFPTLLLLVAAVLPQVCGATVHVAPHGQDDATCGAAAQPCASVGHALTIVSDGGTVLLSPGDYLGCGEGSLDISVRIASERASQRATLNCTGHLSVTKTLHLDHLRFRGLRLGLTPSTYAFSAVGSDAELVAEDVEWTQNNAGLVQLLLTGAGVHIDRSYIHDNEQHDFVAVGNQSPHEENGWGARILVTDTVIQDNVVGCAWCKDADNSYALFYVNPKRGGGAVNAVNVTMVNTTFVGNVGQHSLLPNVFDEAAGASALHVAPAASTQVWFIGCTFRNNVGGNRLQGAGVAYVNTGNNVTFTRSTVEHNVGVLRSPQLPHVHGQMASGVVLVRGDLSSIAILAHVTFEASHVVNNVARSAAAHGDVGAGVVLCEILSQCRISASGTTFARNTATDAPIRLLSASGVFYVTGGDSRIDVDGCTFERNVGTMHPLASGLYHSGVIFALFDVHITSTDSMWKNQRGCDGDVEVCAGCMLLVETHARLGGQSHGPMSVASKGDVFTHNHAYSHNHGGLGAGAVYAVGNVTNLVFEGTTFVGNAIISRSAVMSAHGSIPHATLDPTLPLSDDTPMLSGAGAVLLSGLETRATFFGGTLQCADDEFANCVRMQSSLGSVRLEDTDIEVVGSNSSEAQVGAFVVDSGHIALKDVTIHVVHDGDHTHNATRNFCSVVSGTLSLEHVQGIEDVHVVQSGVQVQVPAGSPYGALELSIAGWQVLQTKEVESSVGTPYTPGALLPLDCPSGTFPVYHRSYRRAQNVHGQVRCEFCPAGQFALSVPNRTHCDAHPTQCTCHTCPEGATCVQSVVRSNRGWYAALDPTVADPSRVVMFPCPHSAGATSPTADVSSWWSPDMAPCDTGAEGFGGQQCARPFNKCADGWTGVMCSACPDGASLWRNRCVACSGIDAGAMAEWAFVLVLLSAFVIAIAMQRTETPAAAEYTRAVSMMWDCVVFFVQTLYVILASTDFAAHTSTMSSLTSWAAVRFHSLWDRCPFARSRAQVFDTHMVEPVVLAGCAMLMASGVVVTRFRAEGARATLREFIVLGRVLMWKLLKMSMQTWVLTSIDFLTVARVGAHRVVASAPEIRASSAAFTTRAPWFIAFLCLFTLFLLTWLASLVRRQWAGNAKRAEAWEWWAMVRPVLLAGAVGVRLARDPANSEHAQGPALMLLLGGLMLAVSVRFSPARALAVGQKERTMVYGAEIGTLLVLMVVAALCGSSLARAQVGAVRSMLAVAVFGTLAYMASVVGVLLLGRRRAGQDGPMQNADGGTVTELGAPLLGAG